MLFLYIPDCFTHWGVNNTDYFYRINGRVTRSGHVNRSPQPSRRLVGSVLCGLPV